MLFQLNGQYLAKNVVEGSET